MSQPTLDEISPEEISSLLITLIIANTIASVLVDCILNFQILVGTL